MENSFSKTGFLWYDSRLCSGVLAWRARSERRFSALSGGHFCVAGAKGRPVCVRRRLVYRLQAMQWQGLHTNVGAGHGAACLVLTWPGKKEGFASYVLYNFGYPLMHSDFQGGFCCRCCFRGHAQTSRCACESPRSC